MRVGKSVKKSIDEWVAGDHESSMLHACNAVDGTARKLYPTLGNSDRFKRFLRDNYEVIGPMGAPGIDIEKTRFPVKFLRSNLASGGPDLADILYGVHRCTHGHGDELPDGFQLIEDAGGPARLSRYYIERGKVSLSDRIIFGMLAAVVLSPKNTGETVPVGYFLSYSSVARLEINDWWGRVADFPKIVAMDPPTRVELDFREWQ